MTQHPTQPGWLPQPPPAPPTSPPPKRDNSRRTVILTIAGIVLGLVILGSLFGDPEPTAPAPESAKVPTVQTATAEPAMTEPAVTSPSFDTPKLADFKLQVKELTRQRFGSAGDLVDYRVQLVQVRDRTYDPDKEYELTYRITGDESGPETQTMLIRGDEYEQYEGDASTRGGVKVKATPTGIEEV
jgi:hypothetical protein